MVPKPEAPHPFEHEFGDVNEEALSKVVLIPDPKVPRFSYGKSIRYGSKREPYNRYKWSPIQQDGADMPQAFQSGSSRIADEDETTL